MSLKLARIVFLAGLCVSISEMAIGADFSYSVDLTQGTLTNSRFANGYLDSISPNYFGLTGSDGLYFPSTRTTYTVNSALKQAFEFASNTTVPALAYYGTTNPGGVTQFGSARGKFGKDVQAAFDNTGTVAYPNDGKTYYFGIPNFKISSSYDYSYSTSDQVGYDTAGGANLSVSLPGSGSRTFKHSISPYETIAEYPSSLPNSISWLITSIDNVGGPGRLSISNFTVQVTQQFDYVGIVAVPEPESYAMLLAGLGLLGVLARRKRSV